jgi:hypothetical protein
MSAPRRDSRNSGAKRALFKSHATVFASRNACARSGLVAFLSFGSQRNPALLTVGCNQHNGPAGVERRPDEPLHEVGFPDARSAADIQELILARHNILIDRLVLLQPQLRQLRGHFFAIAFRIIDEPRKPVIRQIQLPELLFRSAED